MSEKKEKEVFDYNEKIVADEMQRALSFELEHKYMRLWYVLVSLTMPVTLMIFSDPDGVPAAIPDSMQIMTLIQYGIMYFCLSLYNIRASKKGVLDSFSMWQKGGKGLLWFVGFLNFYCPMNPILRYFIDKADETEVIRSYMPFFIVWFCLGITYYIISSYSVYLNKKVREQIAADEEESENNDN
ncbi:MAG: hypothetical protein K2J73_01905 [Oscillospiraceae bacterium]|nr:hypothetical protein [Oscillospiraceae bacterium]